MTPKPQSTDQWTVVNKKLKLPRYGHSAVPVNDTQLLIIGGCDTDDCVTGLVEMFDSVSHLITKIAELKIPRCGACTSTFTIGGRTYVYVSGGSSNGTPLNSVERLSIEKIEEGSNLSSKLITCTQQELILPMAEFRQSAMSAIVNTKLFVFGGYDGKTILRSAELYSPDLNKWTPLPRMPTPRSSAAIAVVDHKIYLIAGRSEYGFVLPSVEIFNTQSQAWEKGPDIQLYLDEPNAFVFGKFIIVVGGWDDGNKTFNGKSFILDTETNKWAADNTTLSNPRSDHSITLLSQTKEMFVIGGIGNQDGEVLGSIERHSVWNLTGMKWKYLLKLRLLDHFGKTTNGTSNRESQVVNDDVLTIKDFITNTNDDIFRTILEFF